MWNKNPESKNNNFENPEYKKIDDEKKCQYKIIIF